MATSYAQHFSTLKTPQSRKADKRQVKNSAGGYSFQLDCWKRLDRWLILGCEGGSYYAKEQELTVENAQTIIECLTEDGPRTVKTIADVSDAGRAPKNDPAIFALAIAAGHSDQATRIAALAALPRVCRIGTHLFQFCAAVEGFRGWGRGLRRAVADWYGSKSPEALAYQVLKYQQRNGWSHRDLLRLCHAELPASHQAIARWVVAGADGLGERRVESRGLATRNYPALTELPTLLADYETLKTTKSEAEVIRLIHERGYTHEMVPNEWKSSPSVWEALLVKMPMHATVRHLAKLTAVGLLKPMGAATRKVCERLADAAAIKKARLHPIAILSALKTYEQGHGERGKLTWSPVREVIDALDEAFYLAFDAIEPSNKRICLALDVSGSMDTGVIAGCPCLTPRIGAAAMAMVTARTEKNWVAMAFSHRLVQLNISPKQRLDDVVRAMSRINFGGTNCSLPMLWAAGEQVEVDAFQVYTDSETWAGSIHPHQALQAYRNKSGIGAAKLAVVGMVANPFTIADPSDPGMLDFVGFDTAAPAVMSDFVRG